jgi:TPR repeat protein
MPRRSLALVLALHLALLTPPSAVAAPAQVAGIFDEDADQNYLAQAEHGDLEAQFQVGQAYLYGMATKADPAEARKWLEKAAARGHADAQFLLATLYEQGVAGPVDVAGALNLYRAAAAQGENRAMVRAGHLLRARREPQEARKWLERAAGNAEPEAQLDLGLLEAEAGNVQQAGMWIDRAASDLDAARYFQAPLHPPVDQAKLAPFERALARLWGAGGPIDPAGAKADFETLAAQGHPAAMYYLAELLTEDSRQPGATKAANEWYRKSALAGYAAAQMVASRLDGMNEKVSREWLRKAAAQGIPEAQFALGSELYHEDASREEGRALLEKAARQGNVAAAYSLSSNGRLGFHVGGDKKTQAQDDWLRFAAERGFSQAQHSLATRLVEQGNVKDAIPWFERAVEQRDFNAARDLAEMYAQGKGVPKDLATAASWYLKELVQGDDNGLIGLASLAARDADLPWAEVLPPLLAAAERGNVFANSALARLYMTGRGVAKDPAKALALYRRTATSGDQSALIAIGSMYAEGNGVPRNDAEAVRWYEKALPNDGVGANLYLARMLRDGRGIKQDLARAIKLLEEAGSRGIGEAYAELGTMYEKGLGVPVDLKKARDYFASAADNGWEPAKEHLKDFVTEGDRLKLVAGQRYLQELRQKAEAGDPAAQLALSRQFLDAQAGVRNPEAGFNWLRKAAEGGLPEAKLELAQAYDNGIAVQHGEQWTQVHQDRAEARRWYEAAAEAGSVPAMQWLARTCYNDPPTAFKWTLKAAQAGDPFSKGEVAQMYAAGTGTKPDFEQALSWAKALGGHGAAIIGHFYDSGTGVAKDDAVAVTWYRRGAEAGDLDAAAALALHLEEGRGTPRDVREAIKWYTKSAQPFDSDPAFAIARLYMQELHDEPQALRWYLTAIDYWNEGGDGTERYGRDEEFKTFTSRYPDLARASYAVAEMAAHGQGLPKDDTEANRWYEAAAGFDQKYPHTAFLAELQLGLRKNSLKDFERAAKLVNEDGQSLIAAIQKVQGIPAFRRGLPAMLKELQEAARQGFGPAAFQLGWLYAAGIGVPRNQRRAKAWQARAQQLGYALGPLLEPKLSLAACKKAASAILASEPLDGNILALGLSKGRSVAYERFLKGLEIAGKAYRELEAKAKPGVFEYMVIHDEPMEPDDLKAWADNHGWTVPEAEKAWTNERLKARAGMTHEPAKQFQLLRQAADGMDGEAMGMVAEAYFKGKIVKRDVVEAYRWMLLARSFGSSMERTPDEEVEKALTPAQRAKAQDAALAWWEKRMGVKLLAGP